MTDRPKVHAAETHVGKKLLQLVVDELKWAQDPWNKMGEQRQEAVIRRADERIKQAVREGFALMLAGDHPAAAVSLDKVAFGSKAIQITCSASKDSEHRHEFADFSGHAAIMVLSDVSSYLARMDEIRAQRDQLELHIPDPPADDETAPPDGGDDTAGGGDEDLEHEDPELEESVLHDMGISDRCVADMLHIARLPAAAPDVITTWNEAERRQVIDYCGARIVAENSQDYLTKGGTIPATPRVLGGDADPPPTE